MMGLGAGRGRLLTPFSFLELEVTGEFSQLCVHCGNSLGCLQFVYLASFLQ